MSEENKLNNNNDDDSDSSISLSDDDKDKKEIKLKDKKEKIFIEFMRFSNEYIKLRHELHVNLARGHLNMARGSRSSLNKTPGKFRKNKTILNKEMSPIWCISQEEDDNRFNLKENDDKNKKQDPLSWFGAMIPRPICIAQTDFKNSLNTLVEMANIKHKLDELSEKWDELLIN